MRGLSSPRSKFAAKEQRKPQDWPNDRDFRILSLDGGGVKGTFTTAFLAELEKSTGQATGDIFDLIVGTSTGGIIAIGLAAGRSAEELENLYRGRGCKIFKGWVWPFSCVKKFLGLAFVKYNSKNLENEIIKLLGCKSTLKDVSKTRLCIQAFDAINGEVAILKTPHHPDYFLDSDVTLVAAALATSAAPAYFRPNSGVEGYLMADGGIWANNPVMVGLVEALTAFNTERNKIKVLSIGCGEPEYNFGFMKKYFGGMLPWANVIYTAMRLQSQSANGQALHLVGPENFVRIDVTDPLAANIELDDWKMAEEKLPDHGKEAFWNNAKKIEKIIGVKLSR